MNALHGTGTGRLLFELKGMKDIDVKGLRLKGVPPLGVCTICIGKKDIGWDNHFGVICKLEGADYLYRGEIKITNDSKTIRAFEDFLGFIPQGYVLVTDGCFSEKGLFKESAYYLNSPC